MKSEPIKQLLSMIDAGMIECLLEHDQYACIIRDNHTVDVAIAMNAGMSVRNMVADWLNSEIYGVTAVINADMTITITLNDKE